MIPIALSEKSLELSFRMIRQQKIKRLAITAACQSEGVSAFAYALARRVATSQIKVLLIDLNMVNGGQSKSLGEDVTAWHPEKLDQKRDIAVLASTNLALLSAPAQLDREWIFQDGAALEKMLTGLSDNYDVIIADLPPLLDKPREVHTESLCAAFDQTLLMAQAGVSDETQLGQAKTLLDKARVSVMGVVINDQHCPSLCAEWKDLIRRSFLLPRFLKKSLCGWLDRNSFINQDY